MAAVLLRNFPTAAFPAVDDYVGIDGGAEGTRKHLYYPIVRAEALPNVRPQSTSNVAWGSALVFTDAEMPAGSYLVSALLTGEMRHYSPEFQSKGDRGQTTFQYSLDAGGSWVTIRSLNPCYASDDVQDRVLIVVSPETLSWTTTGNGLRFRAICRDVDEVNDSQFVNGVIKATLWMLSP